LSSGEPFIGTPYFSRFHCLDSWVHYRLLLRWRRDFDLRGDAAFSAKEAAEVSPTAALEQKVAELERFCGQLSLENCILKKASAAGRQQSGIS